MHEAFVCENTICEIAVVTLVVAPGADTTG